MPIGFRMQNSDSPQGSNNLSSNASAEEHQALEDMRHMLNRESSAYEEFEKRLIRELKSVEDLKTNLKNIQLQISSMENLLMTRENIYRKLLKERNKGQTMDISLCREFLSTIERIDLQQANYVNTAQAELKKLFTDERHLLYSESEDNRKLMESISTQAKELYTELMLISRRYSSLDEDFSRIKNEIRMITIERDKRLSR